MIISTLKFLRSNYFASVNEFIKTVIRRNYETLRRTLSKISKNWKQQLMFTSDLISKTAAKVREAIFSFWHLKYLKQNYWLELLQTIKGLKLNLY